MSDTRHGNCFDFMRLVAALLVVYSHGYPLFGSADPKISGLTSLGGLGVYIFFSISGYLVTQSWMSDPHPVRFFMRRSLRIFPGLIIVVAASALVLGPVLTTLPAREYLGSRMTWVYFEDIFLRIDYYLPGVFEHNPVPNAVNGSLWSLPAEFLMYIVLAVLGRAKVIERYWLVPLFAIVLGTIGLYLVRTYPTPIVFYAMDLRQTFLCGPYFFMGSALYLFRERIALNTTRAVMLFAIMIAAPPTMAITIVSWIVIPCVVIAFCTQSDPLFRIPRRVGDLSYGIYIYAFPVQQTIWYLGHNHLSVLQGIALAIPITASLAWLSWHLVEKRALRLKPKRRDSQSQVKVNAVVC